MTGNIRISQIDIRETKINKFILLRNTMEASKRLTILNCHGELLI